MDRYCVQYKNVPVWYWANNVMFAGVQDIKYEIIKLISHDSYIRECFIFQMHIEVMSMDVMVMARYLLSEMDQYFLPMSDEAQDAANTINQMFYLLVPDQSDMINSVGGD